MAGSGGAGDGRGHHEEQHRRRAESGPNRRPEGAERGGEAQPELDLGEGVAADANISLCFKPLPDCRLRGGHR